MQQPFSAYRSCIQIQQVGKKTVKKKSSDLIAVSAFFCTALNATVPFETDKQDFSNQSGYEDERYGAEFL